MTRRILFGWVNESSRFVQWLMVEVEKLRVINHVIWPTKVLKGGEHLQIHGVMAAQVSYLFFLS